MTVYVTYWVSKPNGSKPVVKTYTNVLRVYYHYSSWSDLDYLVIQDSKDCHYIIRDDVTKLDIRSN